MKLRIQRPLTENLPLHVRSLIPFGSPRVRQVHCWQEQFNPSRLSDEQNHWYSSIADDAWKRGQELTVHGWVYGLHDGLLRDLNICITPQQEAVAACTAAVHNRSGR